MENVEDAGIFICTNALNQKWVEYGKKKPNPPICITVH